MFQLQDTLRSTFFIALLGASLAGQTTAQEAARLLPFQGRLTDQNGVPVTNGVKLVQFKIYDQPSAGTTVWAGEVHRTSINGGLVNVLLGTKTPLPAASGSTESPFNRPLYLEITVDINGDDAISAGDPPMLPRQVILPTLFAKESDDSRRFGGQTPDNFRAGDSSRLGGIPAGDILTSLVPIGAILPFYGDTNWFSTYVSTNHWRLCDGSQVTDPASPFNGRPVPNLIGAFLRGAQGTNGVGTFGGQDSVASHTHSFTTAVDLTPWHPDGWWQAKNQTTIGGPIPHATSGNTGASGAYDNRPRFCSVNYIIRIR